MGNTTSTEKKRPKLIITTAEQASHLLKESEVIDGYRKSIFSRPLETSARASHNYFPLADSQYNKDMLQEWCNNFIDELLHNPVTNWIYAILASNNITVYIVNLQFSADAGMPHTRPLQNVNQGIICFPGGLRGANFEKRTLIHELVHIIQRNKPSRWRQLYKNYWNMEPYAGTLPQKYELARRINPDTLPFDLYIYKNKWVVFCVFNNITNPDIRATGIYYYNTNTERVMTDLPEELRTDEIFGDSKINSSMREHPAELSAWILAEPERFADTWALQHFPKFSK
jgi:hypothetical protein